MDTGVAARIAKRFITLPLDKRVLYLQKMLAEGVSPANLPIPEVMADVAELPLSFAQERQWFLWQLDPQSVAYHIPTALRLRGRLDVAALTRSFNQLIQRHQTLRTTFCVEDARTRQVVQPHMALSIVPEPLPEPLEGEALDAWLQQFVLDETRQLFDLHTGPLLRVRLVRLAADDHALVLTLHHIVSDGWSTQVMVEELIKLYQGYSEGRAVELAALPIQYADYAIWQRRWMEAGERERQLAYWKQQLGDEHPVLQLPADRPRPAQRDYLGARLQAPIEPALAAKLKALAQQHNVTAFMLLLASFQVLLHRYSGQAEIRVGVPVANRNRVETEGLIGFFVNTQVLNARLDGQLPFSALLEQVRGVALGAQAHQDLPFEQLVEALHPERSTRHGPLFQVMFNHQSAGRQAGSGAPAAQLADLSIESLAWENQAAQFDLTLETFESHQGLAATLTYACDIFDLATVKRLAGHWLNLLRGIVENPQQAIGSLPMLAAEEQQRILADGKGLPTAFAAQHCAHHLIQQQAMRRPDAVAVRLDAQQLSYQQLNTRANRLAHRLIEHGVGPDVRVGLAAERSLDMIVGLLAILKAGGAYVPLDPAYPDERLSYMIADSGIGLLLTQAHLRDRLPIPSTLASVLLDDPAGATYSEADPAVAVSPANLAYVIYTSGSTGKPKGVLIPHCNILRLFQATQAWFDFGPEDVWSLFHSYAFDFSVWEIFGALMHGGTLLVVPQEVSRSPQAFFDLLCRERVSVLNQTPSAFKQLMHVACAAQAPALALRYVVFGGEALEVNSLRPWFERFGDGPAQLINMYGITETTVHVTYRPLRAADLDSDADSPIGLAIPDLSMYVLDGDLNLLPPGCTGELYVGRAGLARGYLNQAGLSATRFVADPFSSSGARLYRTGDLARYVRAGVIEYVGRIDHQVKIRGFRIELGEIQARLLAEEGVREAQVLAMDGPLGAQLVGYVVLDQPALDQQQARSQLRAGLKRQLPDYMVPSHLLFVDCMPLTANGKLDRKALPLPDSALAQRAFEAPRGELESRIAAVWQSVLQVERVGRDDNFFELGGHSLLATQVISRIRQVLQIDVALRTLFAHDSLQAFAEALALQPVAVQASIPRVRRDQPLGLSYAQERQWFLWQLEPDSAAYHIPTALRLRGALDVAALGRSFKQLVERHESLRTRFVQQDAQVLQVIEPSLSLVIEAQDCAEEQAMPALVQAQVSELFDLLKGPLLRVKLLRLADDDHVLIITLHHIVADGWSMQLMVDELIQLYRNHSQGLDARLPALPIQYVDYGLWQRQWLQAGERERQLAYWSQRLGGTQPVLELATDRPRPAVQSYAGARLDIAIDAALGAALVQLAQRSGATPFMLLLATFQVLLHRYSGQADIRVGVPIANRNRLETESIIGFFVNTQVLKAEIDGQLPFSEFLQQVKQTALQAQAHQDLPFEQLVDALQPQRSLSHSPLFQVMFNHQAAHSSAGPVNVAGLEIEGLAAEGHTTQFDLKLNSFEGADGLRASLTYATDLFDRATVQDLAGHWLGLLHAVVSDSSVRIGELPMLSREQRHQQLQDWNATHVDYALEQSVQQRIEAQVERTPDAIALVFGEQQLSYRQLNSRANQLAHRLIDKGVGADVLVGVAAERSVEMVVALLAILKAGGAYVPLDPEYPRERLAYLFEDSGIGLLLCQAHVRSGLPIPEGLATIDLDAVHQGATSNPQVSVDGQNLAYVIYTSGSTGKPKGAGNSHAALVNRLCWMQDAYALADGDTVMQKTPFSFDVSVWEFFWPLMTGARLLMAAPGEHRDPARLIELITRHQVTTLHFVPSMLQAFMQDRRVGECTSLQRIICSGEALPVGAQEQVFAKLAQAQLYNLYGPTEAAIDVTHWTCRDEQRDSVPIGVPIANLSTLILDDALDLLPVGAVGELYLGGTGLARGYHRRPGLTAERFIPHPFVVGERLYRTGDLARHRIDGVIDYIGRIDHQVKIRGLRIELGEIEARLLEHLQVREASVIALDMPTGKQLAAYVVGGDLTQGPQDLLAEHLQQTLPDYMVPAHWVVLERMPLSPNGKLDRKALPAPGASVAQASHVAPVNATQRALADIWQTLLGVARVGITDNFFSLGGDSIVSIQVVSRARQQGINLTPKDVFKHQTIQTLALAAVQREQPVVAQGPVLGQAPLTPIQAWFFASPIPERQHWNQSVLLRPTSTLDPLQLGQILHALVTHHDALRMVFAPVAQYAAQAGDDLLWQRSVAHGGDLAALGEQAQRSLDLQQGPLLRAVLATLDDGSQRLLLVIHHLVVDGISWRILLEDLQTLYRQLQAGTALTLPAKTSSFKAWAEHLQAYATTPALTRELPYWLAQRPDGPADLPVDRHGASLSRRHATSVYTGLGKDLTRRLLQDAPGAYRTQINDLLLAALARVIGRWTGAASTLIQLEGHGREDLFDDLDLSRTVGWFSSLFPVKLTPATDLSATIKQVKEQLRAIPDKGVGYGVLRYLGDTEVQQALQALPQPRITFNYLGQFDGSFEHPDGAVFVPCAEPAGAEQSPEAPLGNWLSLNGQVYDGQLSLAWSFSTQMYDAATVQRLADDYAVELRGLIEHCAQAHALGFTPSDFALARLDQACLDSLPLPLDQLEDLYPLSPMQQGMLFHTQEASGADVYINQLSVAVDGLDSGAFIDAWNRVIARHEILRSGFWSASHLREPLQVVYKSARLPVRQLDWRQRDCTLADLEAVAAEDCAQGFDLLKAPLTRLTLVRLDEQRYQLIWTSHHILMDGWSNSRLLGEVFEAYAGQPAPAKPGRYRDYIAWLQEQSPLAQAQFWKDKLQAISGPTLLAGGLVPPPATLAEGHQALYLRWDVAQTQRLREQARDLRVTPNTLIQATWLLLLQRFTGQDTVCFGAIVAGRPAALPGSGEMLGLFINTLPIIQAPQPADVVAEWLLALQDYNLQVRDYEHSSLADIQRWAGQGGQALFDSIIVFENYPVDQRLKEAGSQQLQFGEVNSRDVTNYAMDLAVHLEQTLSIEFLYLSNRFTEAAALQIRRSFEALLTAILEAPQARIGSLDMLAEAETARLSAQNHLAQTQPGEPLLAAAIAAHALARPDAVAVVCGAQQLTYGELESRANRLAHHLISQGVGPEVFVGIALERSVEVIVAFYAVMKTGGAYVPLDIDYPKERFDWIVRDSAMAVLLTQHSLRERWDDLPVPCLIELDRLSLAAQADTCPLQTVDADNLAYLIYTSGSTGQPKGVAVAHGPIRMHCEAIAQRYEMDTETRELLFMSFAFDGAQERWLSTLLSGGRLVVRENRLWTPEETWQALHQHRISIACFPPAYLQQLGEFAEGREAPPVQIYCFGGDAVADANFELVKRTLKPRYLTNGYGPTETVVTPLLWKVDMTQRCEAVYAPIGTRIGERSLYVLDTHLNPVPDGVAGELYIGGEGLARGYHQRSGLTAQRFVADPFSRAGGRLYRTGDLVRQRADGVIDYLGRLDHQVKIRGFRIELGEIEARLRQLADVRDAVVVARDTQGGKQLIGYVVAPAANGLAERLRGELLKELPDYMLPAQILVLEQFPLSPNGKLDRKALPDPEFKGRAYVAPRNAMEKGLAAIWQAVLEVEQVGVTDNFFELGGDSLRILKVLSRVRQQPGLGLTLKLRDLMLKPTIGELSGYAGDEAGELDPLLLLNGQVADQPALFCLHAGFGTVFDYEPLARLLDGQRSVYGLQCRMLLDRAWEDDSLTGMAVDYAQYIRQKQVNGPYCLLGWSLGGPLAMLVADELEKQGQAVEFVGLVDSFMPVAKALPVSTDYQVELRSFLALVMGLAPEQIDTLDEQAARDPAQLERFIQGLQATLPNTASVQFEAQDLAHTFGVAMKLKALSEQALSLPTLNADAYCWWAGEATSLEHRAFEQRLHRLVGNETVAATHFDILRHPAFLHSLLRLLPTPELIDG